MKRYVGLWLIAILACGAGFPAGAQNVSLTFDQLSFNLDGTIYDHTEWGSVNLTYSYTGSEQILYFNLSVNDSWQVQNWPVVVASGLGGPQSTYLSFDLGTARGTPVTSLNYGYSLTTDILANAPLVSSSAAVLPRQVTYSSGLIGAAVPHLPAAGPSIGGAATAYAYTHEGKSSVPNQDCGLNECVPAAISNSLKLLRSRHGLDIEEEDITIEKMKEALKWGTYRFVDEAGPKEGTGCWYYDGEKEDWSTGEKYWHEAFHKSKDKYLKKKGIPVSTRVFGRQEIDNIGKEIERGQDVEVVGAWHTAMLVSIVKLENGRYVLKVAHDTKQGEPGGTIMEEITYDPETGRFSGSPGFFERGGLHYFVVECPVPEPVFVQMGALMGLSGLGFLAMRRRA